MRRIPLCTCLTATLSLLFLMPGCADDKNGPTTHAGDAIMRDPFGYKPTMDDPNISGGGLGHYDDKAMKKDLKSVFDP
jgi:hypothetical protein